MQPKRHLGVAAAFCVTAEYYGRPITDVVAQLYEADLADLDDAVVLQALAQLRRQPKRRQCPLPAEVRSWAERGVEGVSPEQLAARIVGAIARFGYTRPTAAREHIGEAGWAAVLDLGGWAGICQRLQASEVGTFTAQARELCRTYLERGVGPSTSAPALPGRMPTRLQAIAGGIGVG